MGCQFYHCIPLGLFYQGKSLQLFLCIKTRFTNIYFMWLNRHLMYLFTFLFQVNYLKHNDRQLEESAWCSVPFDENDTGALYMTLTCILLFFIIPLFIVIILYAKIAVSFSCKRRTEPSQHSINNPVQNQKYFYHFMFRSFLNVLLLFLDCLPMED